MGQNPSTIREDIEQTRERMGETVEALAYKSDVKARTKDSVTGRVGAVKEKIVGVAGSVDDATPSSDDLMRSTRRAVSVAESNPLGLAVGAAAVGFLVGMITPVTSIENEKIGPMADQVKSQAKEAAQTAVDHGVEAAQDAVGAAKEAGHEHAAQATADLKQQAQQAREEMTT